LFSKNFIVKNKSFVCLIQVLYPILLLFEINIFIFSWKYLFGINKKIIDGDYKTNFQTQDFEGMDSLFSWNWKIYDDTMDVVHQRGY
jgi:hypothetical protein